MVSSQQTFFIRSFRISIYNFTVSFIKLLTCFHYKTDEKNIKAASIFSSVLNSMDIDERTACVVDMKCWIVHCASTKFKQNKSGLCRISPTLRPNRFRSLPKHHPNIFQSIPKTYPTIARTSSISCPNTLHSLPKHQHLHNNR